MSLGSRYFNSLWRSSETRHSCWARPPCSTYKRLQKGKGSKISVCQSPQHLLNAATFLLTRHQQRTPPLRWLETPLASQTASEACVGLCSPVTAANNNHWEESVTDKSFAYRRNNTFIHDIMKKINEQGLHRLWRCRCPSLRKFLLWCWTGLYGGVDTTVPKASQPVNREMYVLICLLS